MCLKNYENKMKKNTKNKKAQVTLFVIIAIAIVFLSALIFLAKPNVKSVFDFSQKSPQSYIRSCIENDLALNTQLILFSGGELAPNHPYLYKSQYIDFAVYTRFANELGAVESPMIKSKVEGEIKKSIEEKINSCMDALIKDFEKKGYSTNLERKEQVIKIMPDGLYLNLNLTLTATKTDSSVYENFVIFIPNNFYEMLSVANEIINKEASVGDVNVYQDLNIPTSIDIDKERLSDGVKIYTITGVNPEYKLRIASRTNTVREDENA